MGRHHADGDDAGLAALLEGWNAGLSIAPAPRSPVDEITCPYCGSSQTARYGARAHCGDCNQEWPIGATADDRRARFQARRQLDQWAAARPAPERPDR